MMKKPAVSLIVGLIALFKIFEAMALADGEQYILKIPKTPALTATLQQHSEIGILQELNTCYLAVTTPKTLSNLAGAGISYQLLLQTTQGSDRLFLIYLKDINDLAKIQRYGLAFQVEGNHVLFQSSDFRPQHQLLSPMVRGIRKLNFDAIGAAASLNIQKEESITQTAVNPEISEMANSVSQSGVCDNIQTLQNFATRDAATQGCVLAGDFLAAALLLLGLQVEEDYFGFEGYTSRNIIGWLPGKKDLSSVIIISAHYDSYAEPNSTLNAPGADDDASGTAAVLEAAKILSGYNFKYSIKFILFSAEEWGLYGSAHYAKTAADTGEKIIGVINLDMVSFADHLPEDLDVIVNPDSDWMAAILESCAQNYSSISVAKTVDASFYYADHYSFWERHFPAVLAIEDYEDTNPYYHTNNDTTDTINSDFVTQVTRTCMAAVAQMAEPFNVDPAADMMDVIAALQICAGLSPARIPAPLGSDPAVGMDEAIYLLQKAAGIR